MAERQAEQMEQVERMERWAPKLLVVSIERLREAPWNFKQDDPEALASLKEDLKRYGQVANCNVRELSDGAFEVIDGNHRLRVYRELGVKEVIVYNHGPISEAEAIRIAHELTPYFEVDPAKQGAALAAFLEEGGELTDLASVSRFREEDLLGALALHRLTEGDWEELTAAAQRERGAVESGSAGGEGEGLIALTFTLPNKAAKEAVLTELARLRRICRYPSANNWDGILLERMIVGVT